MKLAARTLELPRRVARRVGRAKARVSAPTFRSWDEAAAVCGAGYQDETLLRVIHEKTRRYRDSLALGPVELDAVDLRIILGLTLLAFDNPVRVLDFGGACGAHFFMARSLLPDLAFRWSVVETPGMMTMARDFEDADLSFVDSISSATAELGSVDVVLSSGALQYSPDPRAALRELLACRARLVVLTRLALTDGPDVFSVSRSMLADHGRGPLPPEIKDAEVVCPIALTNQRDFSAFISDQHRIRAHFVEERNVYSVGSLTIDHSGYLAERTPG